MTDFIRLNKKKPYIIGVAGGSGSGKTFFAKSIQQKLGMEFCSILYQDNFYFDQSANFDHDGGSVNFDHPDAIDFNLLAEKIAELKKSKIAYIPIYDFVTHSRINEELLIPPLPIILVDGILIFHNPKVRELFDDLIFFDTPEEIRFQRRIERDVVERGRTPEGVKNQFMKQVKPMHDKFVQPSMIYANTIVNDDSNFDTFLERYLAHLSAKI